jgi:hypothetical protein
VEIYGLDIGYGVIVFDGALVIVHIPDNLLAFRRRLMVFAAIINVIQSRLPMLTLKISRRT